MRLKRQALCEYRLEKCTFHYCLWRCCHSLSRLSLSNSLIHVLLQFYIPHYIKILFCHLGIISLQSSLLAASLGPWETIPHGTKPLVACCSLARFSMSTGGNCMITRDFASQSRYMIVLTLDDLTLVMSVTLMCPLLHTAHVVPLPSGAARPKTGPQ